MITKEGYPFIIVLLILTLVIRIIGHVAELYILMDCAVIPGLLLLFCLNFFRDPKREIPKGKGIFVSPADGKIVQIKSIEDPDIGKANLVSIFLNVFNVHVNRTPVGGSISEVQHKKGKFLAAFNHSASDENEQSNIHIHSKEGMIKVKQIAGLIARRILNYMEPEMVVEKGQRLGFIRFGSRVDIIVPSNFEINVSLGDIVEGNLSIIGEFE